VYPQATMSHERFVQIPLTGIPRSSTLESGAIYMSDGVSRAETATLDRPGTSSTPSRTEAHTGVPKAFVEATPVGETQIIDRVLSTEFRNPQLATRVQELRSSLETDPIENWSKDRLVQVSARWKKDAVQAQKDNPYDAEIRGGYAMIGDQLFIEAISKGMNPIAYQSQVDSASGTTRDRRERFLEVAGKLKELRETGRLSEVDYERADRLMNERLREMVKSEGASSVTDESEDRSDRKVLNFQFGTNPEWTTFDAWRNGHNNTTWEFPQIARYAEELVHINQIDQMNAADIRQVRTNFLNSYTAAEPHLQPQQRIEADEFLDHINRLLGVANLPEKREQDRDSQFRDLVGRYGALAVGATNLKEIVSNATITEAQGEEAIQYVNIALRSDPMLSPRDRNILADQEFMDLVGIARASHADDDWKRAIERFRTVVADRLAERLNIATNIWDYQIDAIVGDDEAMRKYITRIISMPLKKKKQEYRLDFYPQNNLSAMEQGIQDWIDEVPAGTNEHDRRVSFQYEMNNRTEGISHIHNLHFMITTNQLRNFGDYAARINNEHLHSMIGEKGAAKLLRLFEIHFDRFLATDGRITTVSEHGAEGEAGSFDLIMGYTDRNNEYHEGTVVKSFDRMFRVMQDSPEFQGIDKYQLDFVKSVGQYMYMTFLRAHEKTALGKMPEGPAFISRLPGGDITAMLNWYGGALTRWAYGETAGGQEFTHMATEVYDRIRKDHGYDVPLLKEIKSVDVATMEYALMTGAQAHNRSWREAVIYLDNAPFIDPRTRQKGSVLQFLEIGDDSVKSRVKEAFMQNRHRGRQAIADATSQVLRESFLDANNNLRPEFNSGLGALLMHSVLRPSDVTKQNYGDGYTKTLQEIREAIFARAVENNPLEIAFMLQGAKVHVHPSDFQSEPQRAGEDDHAYHKRVEEERHNNQKAWERLMVGRTPAEQQAYAARSRMLNRYFETNGINIAKGGADHDVWFGNDTDENIGLQEKLTIANEIRLDSIREAYRTFGTATYTPEKTLDQILAERPELQLDDAERALLGRIRNGGIQISKDLANIRFPNTPFLNDMIYETANYSNAGPTSFGASFADIVRYNETQGQLTQLAISPADVKPEDFLEVMKKAVLALEDPLGTDTAQDLLYSFVEAYTGFIWAGGVKKSMGESWLAEMMDQVNVKMHVKEKWFKLATSVAQVYGGNKAASLTVEQMDDFIKQLLVHKIIRRGIYSGEHAQEEQFGLHQMRNKVRSSIRAPFLKLLGKEEEPHFYAYTDLTKKLKKRFYLDNWFFKLLKNIFDLSAIVIPVASLDTAKEGGKEATS